MPYLGLPRRSRAHTMLVSLSENLGEEARSLLSIAGRFEISDTGLSQGEPAEAPR